MPKREMSELEIEEALGAIAEQVGMGPRKRVVGWIVFFVHATVAAMKSPYESTKELRSETWKCVTEYVYEEGLQCR